jgi:hypothetical protein
MPWGRYGVGEFLALMGGALALLCAGCPTPECEGAGCADLYDQARVGVLLGENAGWSGTIDAMDGVDGEILGGVEDGPSWSLAVHEGVLFIGMPEASEVTRKDLSGLPLDTSISRSGPRVLSTAPEERFGEALALLDPWTTPRARGLLVGAPRARGRDGAVEGGRIYVFDDIESAWAVEEELSSDQASLVLLGQHAYDQLGATLASCGDLDGDGLADFLVGSPWDQESGGSLSGSVSVVLSSRLGLGDVPPEAKERLLEGLGPNFSSSQAGARVGVAMECAHDLDGDSIPDLVISAPYADDEAGQQEAAGAVYLVGGRDLNASKGGNLEQVAEVTLRGLQDEAYFGASLLLEDLDMDGLPDLLVGAPGADDAQGRVYIHLGLAEGWFSGLATARLRGEEVGDRFGSSLCVGDFEADGGPDLVVGAPMQNPSGRRADFASGALYLWAIEGDPRDLARRDDAVEATAVIRRAQGHLQTGAHVLCGDLNQDLRADLLFLNKVRSD